MVTFTKARLRHLHMSRPPPETTTNLNQTALPCKDIRVLRQKAPQTRRRTSSGDQGKSKRHSDHFSADPKNLSHPVHSCSNLSHPVQICHNLHQPVLRPNATTRMPSNSRHTQQNYRGLVQYNQALHDRGYQGRPSSATKVLGWIANKSQNFGKDKCSMLKGQILSCKDQ